MTMRALALLASLLFAVSLPAQVRITRDLSYGADSAQKLDVYRPLSCPATGCPVVVWLHGHGAAKTLTTVSYQFKLPAYRGITVASCDYRTDAQGESDSSTLADVKKCRRWLTANAATWQVDTTRVACWGSSLGAYLCNWLLTTCGNTAAGRGTPDECVRGGVALYGASDLRNYVADLTALGCTNPPTGTAGDSASWAASPLHYVTATSPPWMGLHARDDCTVAYTQSVRMDSLYRALGAVSRLRLYDGFGHGGPAWAADSIVTPQLNFLSAVLK